MRKIKVRNKTIYVFNNLVYFQLNFYSFPLSSEHKRQKLRHTNKNKKEKQRDDKAEYRMYEDEINICGELG